MTKCDIVEVAQELGMDVDADNRASCPACGTPDTRTLAFDRQDRSFRCDNPQCNAHGDVITLVRQHTGLPFEAALGLLAESVAMKPFDAEDKDAIVEFGRVRDCMNAAARFYARRLADGLDYCAKRGISEATAREFFLGAASGQDDLARHLIDCGFRHGTIERTGLLNQHGMDRFQNHVVVPILRRGQVVGLLRPVDG